MTRPTDRTEQRDDVRELVRARYAAAAVAVRNGEGPAEEPGACCAPTGATTRADGEPDESFGAGLYAAEQTEGLPAEAVLASLGCGNPTAVADLHPGERVLDLGSGGGIDVLLSARRVGPTGFAYGVDMTAEMLELARENAARAGVTNVEFLGGTIEALPLPDAAVDVVISNCVVNLSPDKAAVLAEAFRVLVPGGRLGISDVVAEDDVTPAQRAERGSTVGCIAGALSRTEYLAGLAAAGFTDASVEFTHPVAPGLHGALVRATRPIPASAPGEAADRAAPQAGGPTPQEAGGSCCAPVQAVDCCTPTERSACCGAGSGPGALPSSCGCLR